MPDPTDAPTPPAEALTGATAGSDGAGAPASSAGAEAEAEAAGQAGAGARGAGEAAGEGEGEGAGDEAWRARLPSPIHPPTRFELALYRSIRAALMALSRLWFRLEVVDKDRMPAGGPFVLAPVHRSNIDFFLVAALTRTRMRYMGKDSLWKSAPFGRFLAALGAFPVRRGKADREALRTCMTIIENGEPLVMFPEGTRHEGDTVDEVFDGPAYVAARTGVPLVPVGIGGSDAAMPVGARWIKPAKVVLVVGDPIRPPKGDGSGRVPRRVVREMTEQLRTDVQRLYDDARRRAGD
jgi:1-acyl-sn-glycerol-3-phosphate acyltransferase